MSRLLHRLVPGALLALAAFTAMAGGKQPQQTFVIGADAQFVSQGVPATMVVGQSYPVSVMMYNNSSSEEYDWSDSALGAQNPANNTTWGVSQVAVGTSVQPGSDHSFNFTVTAPTTPGTYNFQWRMRVSGSPVWFGDLTPNVAVVVVSPPAVPTLTLPTSSTTGSYTVSWTTSSGATHYELSEQVGAGSWAVIQDTSATSRAISGKPTGSYSYRVRACTGTGTGACSAYSAAKTINVALPPAVPTLTLPTSSTTGSYTASWTTSSGATHYELSEKVGAGSWAVIQDTSAISRAISGKTTGSYSYRVRACTGTGTGNCSGYSATKTINVAIPPPVPTLTLPTSSVTGTYTASWTSTSGATHYELSEKVGAGSWAVIQDTSAISRAITGKATGSYSYRVRACTGTGTGNCSGYSATRTINVAIPPSVPTLTLPTSNTTGSYTASWTTASGATHYELSEQVGAGSWAVIQDTTATTRAISGKTDGSYSYRVRACAGTGTGSCSGYSTTRTISVAIPPPPPAVPALTLPTASTTGSFTASWTASSSATHYELSEQVGSGSWTVIQDTSALNRVVSGKTDGSYGYRVRACAGTGTGSCSAYSAIRTVSVSTEPSRTYTYNSYQELCRVVEPETGTTLMGYDAAGNLSWSASGLDGEPDCSATGNTAAILARKAVRTYDTRNRVSTLTFPDNNGNQAWDYTPDGLPESITTWNDGGASSVINSYLYNKRRLPIAESLQADTHTWTVGYGYDGNANLATLTYPDSLSVAYAPNALGQPKQAGTFATNVTYHPNGAIAGFTYGNGIVHTMTRNARGLPELSQDADGATAILQDEYVYDENGNVTYITDAAAGREQRGNRDMVYDDLDRLVSATSPMFGTASYTYDAVDNLTHLQVTGGSQPRNHTYCYDEYNRLTNVKSTACTVPGSVIGLGYDVQGNLANKNGVNYTFDYGNRLRSGGPETYRYDAHGRRVRSSSSAGLAYSFYSQSGQVLFQRDERGSKRRQYIYLGGSLVAEHSRPLSGSTATVTYQHTDALGSPVATTNSAKTVLQRSEYEPYGFLANRPVQDGPGYTGHITDAATGLVYMQQRYYDPMIPRFLSVDPVTAYSAPVAMFNRYRYAGSSPYGFNDPDGRCPPGLSHICGDAPRRTRRPLGENSDDEEVSQSPFRRGPPSIWNGESSPKGGTSALNDPGVHRSLQKAWKESNPEAPAVAHGDAGSLKHEQGGWVMRLSDGTLLVIRVLPGTRDSLPTMNGTRPASGVVAWFHTHPNTKAEGYTASPSPGDIGFTHNYAKVPGIVLTHEGVFWIPYP